MALRLLTPEPSTAQLRASLTLPYPPSANRLWRAVNGRQIKSAEYREYMSRCVACILAQRPEKLSGPYRLTIVATPPDRRARDIDNLIKPTSDALAQAGVIDNDSQCRSVLAMWSDDAPVPHGKVVATLQEG